MNASRKLVFFALACVFAFGCRPKAGHEHGDEHAHSEDEHSGSAAATDAHGHGEGEDAHGHEEGGDSGHLPLAGVRGVSFETVGEPQQEWVWYAAEAIAEEGAVAVLTAPVSGVIVALRAAPGEQVRAGAPIVALRSPELADLKAAWLSARARRVRAELEAERERRLYAGQATSQRDLEAAEAEAAVAAADEEAARLALSARGLPAEEAGASVTVRAPRAGTVAALPVHLGQSVAAGETLGELLTGAASLARVELPLPAPEAWAAGAASEVRRSDGRRWPARVEGVPAALTSDTRRLAYRLRLTGGDLPVPGTPLEARVPLARGLVLPQTALQQIEGAWGVFVREGEEASFRPVQKGAELGGDVLVLAGLAPGETVATDGAYLLKALHLKLAGGGGGHDH